MKAPEMINTEKNEDLVEKLSIKLLMSVNILDNKSTILWRDIFL